MSSNLYSDGEKIQLYQIRNLDMGRQSISHHGNLDMGRHTTGHHRKLERGDTVLVTIETWIGETQY